MQTSVLQRRKLSRVCTTFFFFTESTCIVCLAVDTLMLCVTSLKLDASLADTQYKLAVGDDNPDSLCADFSASKAKIITSLYHGFFFFFFFFFFFCFCFH